MIERECDIDKSIKNIKTYINNNLNLNFSITQLSNYTYLTRLYKKNIEVDRGIGKGNSKESIASSLFESVEHYLLNNSKTKLIKHLSKKEIFNQDLFYIIKNDLFMMADYKDEKQFHCRIFKELHSKNIIYYPEELINPDYSKNKKILSKYSTNNGTAIGNTKNEALIHSINEIIERDTISMFILNTFINNTYDGATTIELSSLPKKYKKLINDIKKSGYSSVQLLKLYNEFSIPTYLTIAKGENKYVAIGSGTSLYNDYACERSIYECIQNIDLLINDSVLKAEYKKIYKYYSNDTKLFEILTMDFKEKFDTRNFEKINYQRMSIKDYLQTQYTIIYKQGFKIYYSTLENSPNVYCVQVKIPCLEEFHLILSGSIIAPKNRGLFLIGG